MKTATNINVSTTIISTGARKLYQWRAFYRTVFIVSIVLFSAAFAIIPYGNAESRQVSISQGHGSPGTTVAVQGTGWHLSVDDYCYISGDAVKSGSGTCRARWEKGIYEPVGSFTIANLPAGSYTVFVTVQRVGRALPQPETFKLTFNVD